MGKYTTTFRATAYKECRLSVRMLLYKGNGADEQGRWPVAVRLIWEGKQQNITTDVRMTEAEFAEACEEERKNSRRLSGVRAKMGKAFAAADAVAARLCERREFSLDVFRSLYYNQPAPETVSIYRIWEDVAASASVGTEDNYRLALTRFRRDMGDGVRLTDLDRPLLEEWRRRMEGDPKVGKTTVCMYLRAFRTIMNEGVRRRLLDLDTQRLWAGMNIGGRNSYNSRRHEYLDVATWRKLWEFYESRGKGNAEFATWRDDYRRDRLSATGMMLFMYLSNGMNLRDALALRYDDFYFQHGRRQFRCFRQKVAGRTDAEIVFPVLPELREILRREARPEERGARVFNYYDRCVSPTLTGRERDRRVIDVTKLYNSVLCQRMKSVARALELDAAPTPTWCRHSFATNLTQRGVPRDYISQSMAHSLGDTTANYIDRYSLQQMTAFNRRLLSTEAEEARDKAREVLGALTAEEKRALLEEL